MKLIIKIENGVPVDHPIIFENFLMVNRNVDYDNLPEGYAKFIRVPPPTVSTTQKVNPNPEYVLVDGVYTDSWTIRDLTDQEKTNIIEMLNQTKPFPSWIVDTSLLVVRPPIPQPDDNYNYSWNEGTLSWDQITE